MNMNKLPLIGLTLVTLIALPETAFAKRPGVLENKPIVERKKEHRKLRLQVTPFAAMSIAQPYIHVGSAGGKLRFNITDTLGIRGLFEFAPIALKTKLTRALNGDTGEDEDGGKQSPLPIGVDNPNSAKNKPGVHRPNNRREIQSPLLHDFHWGLTRLQWQGSADITFTPFAGKLGLFSSIFQSYDLYLFVGVGFQNWTQYYQGREEGEIPGIGFTNTSKHLGLTPNTSNQSLEPGACIDAKTKQANTECVLHPVEAQTGMKIGPSFGGGVNIFITDWLAINPEVQDVITWHNDTGFSSNREIFPVVDRKDNVLRHNITLRLGFSFYVPPKVKRRTTKP